jgi:hypothetical protein
MVHDQIDKEGSRTIMVMGKISFLYPERERKIIGETRGEGGEEQMYDDLF